MIWVSRQQSVWEEGHHTSSTIVLSYLGFASLSNRTWAINNYLLKKLAKFWDKIRAIEKILEGRLLVFKNKTNLGIELSEKLDIKYLFQ